MYIVQDANFWENDLKINFMFCSQLVKKVWRDSLATVFSAFQFFWMTLHKLLHKDNQNFKWFKNKGAGLPKNRDSPTNDHEK